MSLLTGLAAQLGIAQETTWGTRVVPDHFYEFVSESLKNDLARIESKGLRSNNRVLRTDRWGTGKSQINGDIEIEVPTKGAGLLFKHALGGAAIAASGSGWKQTFVMEDPLGLGMTIQVGRPDTEGTVNCFEYTGCKVESFELSNSVDDLLMMKLGIDGDNETTNQTLATASYPADFELFYFTQGTVTLGGVEYAVQDWAITNTVGIKTDRFFINNQNRKREQVLNAFADLGGSFSAEFENLVPYNRFVDGTLAELILTYETVTEYDTGLPYKIVITVPNIRFDGETPNVGGPDVVTQSLPFKVLNDGVAEPITIEYYSSDAAP